MCIRDSSSTSFANPAVAIARTFTESFTGISYLNTPYYILAELVGMLIANTIATGAGLFVLITVFADVSGAHFNPFVSIAMTITGKLKKELLPYYIIAQLVGCLIGVGLANFFFEHEIYELSTKSRDGIYIFTSEVIATLGLIIIIFGSMKSGKIAVAASVGLYITAGYWFTSSTSFANPAVAIARTFTESFTGISLSLIHI